jgi:hypothetical protein
MRAVKRFFAGSLSAVAVVIVACGGSSEGPPGANDSGVNGDGATLNDSSLGDGSAAGDDGGDACVPTDASLSQATPADAALNEAGASVGTCIACAQASCLKEINDCSADCACENVFTDVFDCLSGVGNTLLSCFLQFSGSVGGSNTNPAELALAQCAVKTCTSACALCSLSAQLCPTPPADAGTDASDDAAATGDAAATDAATDATGD